MTLAEQFYTAYDNISWDPDYDCCNWVEWAPLMKSIYNEAVEEIEESTGSCDPTTVYKFSDGSALLVANPRQAVYAGYMQVVA